MRFVNMTNYSGITDAIKCAESLLDPCSRAMCDINLKNDWKYNSGKGLEISYRLHTGKNAIKVFTYRPWNPFTAAIAMTKGDGAIHFNIYKIDKTSLESKVGTILHEYAHICGFTHGNNYKTKDKCLFSVPYFLSENVSRWL